MEKEVWPTAQERTDLPESLVLLELKVILAWAELLEVLEPQAASVVMALEAVLDLAQLLESPERVDQREAPALLALTVASVLPVIQVPLVLLVLQEQTEFQEEPVHRELAVPMELLGSLVRLVLQERQERSASLVRRERMAQSVPWEQTEARVISVSVVSRLPVLEIRRSLTMIRLRVVYLPMEQLKRMRSNLRTVETRLRFTRIQ